MPKTRTLLALVLAPLLLFAVACGGDDDDDSSSVSATGGQPAASDSSSSGSGDSSSSSSGDSSSSSGGGSISGDCAAFAGYSLQIASAFTGATAGSDDVDLSESADFFKALADKAPDEIKGDMQLIAEGFAEFVAVLEEHNIDFSNPATFATLDPAALAALEEASEKFDSPEYEEASNNIDAWFDENCG